MISVPLIHRQGWVARTCAFADRLSGRALLIALESWDEGTLFKGVSVLIERFGFQRLPGRLYGLHSGHLSRPPKQRYFVSTKSSIP